jgi:hypothetical protein
MKTLLAALCAAPAVLTIGGIGPAEAGKWVAQCRDDQGRVHFSDAGCAMDAQRERTFYAPNAQGYSRNRAQAKREEPREAAHHDPDVPPIMPHLILSR